MLEVKYWKGGYLQTGNGDEITIITRDQEGKRIERICFNANDLEEVISKLTLCKKPKKQETIF